MHLQNLKALYIFLFCMLSLFKLHFQTYLEVIFISCNASFKRLKIPTAKNHKSASKNLNEQKQWQSKSEFLP